MPSQKILEKKQAMVAALAEELKTAKTVVIVDYKGINVAQDTKLRKDCREAGVTYRVVKNTLLKRAAHEAGVTEWDDILEGTTAIALGQDDVIAPARVVVKFAESVKNMYTVKGGFIDQKPATVAELEELANVPAKEVLLARVLGGLNSPIVGLAMTIKEIANQKESA